ncbi:V-type ATP synthase subunit A-like protein [Rhodopirellula maiorica SM1]|uniref:V-type ATP synthase subunit A-like protein n=1 Tax=Rhodopirellula maiorica SM1 TaxID=1265738 RepID=M5S3L4_9BACT|nr:DUF2764 family protein [Rhodopirellula maiorica]EMI20769.1 V-type ATP synthase subunit A-like protein [Rhodopirellula maiorica SM1]
MYYDLICSLPHLPHFEKADWLPITPLRLRQRLSRLQPKHAVQLELARPLVGWRCRRLTGYADHDLVIEHKGLTDTQLDAPLRDYIEFRMTQQTLIAALRRRHDGLERPADSDAFGFGPSVHSIRKHWDTPHFGLQYRYPWLPMVGERLSAGDAIGLERLLMDLNWQWLTRCAEQSMFGFAAVMAFVFKWDMLGAWLANDPLRAKARFTELIDKVTHV